MKERKNRRMKRDLFSLLFEELRMSLNWLRYLCRRYNTRPRNVSSILPTG